MAGLVTGDVEQRLRAVEDRFAIEELINAYGPAVDAGNVAALKKLWREDGWYEIDGARVAAADLADIIERETHQNFLALGCAHIMSPPRIELVDDRALARNYSCVLTRAGEGWKAERVSINRWTFTRQVDGWRIETRTNALATGPEAINRIFDPPLTKSD